MKELYMDGWIARKRPTCWLSPKCPVGSDLRAASCIEAPTPPVKLRSQTQYLSAVQAQARRGWTLVG